MGWSDWIQDPPSLLDSYTVAEWQVDSYLLILERVESAQSGWQTDADGTVTSNAHVGSLSTLGAGWEDYRNWWPDALGELTEGVDFAAIPGTSDYVEYETGVPNVHAGWSMPDVAASFSKSRVFVVPGGTDRDADVPGSHLSVEINYGLPAIAPGGVPAFPGEGTGDVILGTLDTYVVGQVFAGTADPGPVSSVGLFVYDPNQLILPPAIGLVWDAAGTAYWTSGPPRPKITLPRYRYWIPDTTPPPLRQVQRNDGLGRSVMRARGGTSVQMSIRQRGYR